MSKLFGDQSGANGGDLAPKHHMEYRYLITEGWSQQWVHCPVCLARNRGYTPSGQPLYSGGTVLVKTQVRGHVVEVLVACTCEVGEGFHEKQGIPTLGTHHPDNLVRPVATVLWDMVERNRRPRPEELPEEPDLEKVKEYTRRLSEQVSRFAKGEITGLQMKQNEQALRDKFMPPRMGGEEDRT